MGKAACVCAAGAIIQHILYHSVGNKNCSPFPAPICNGRSTAMMQAAVATANKSSEVLCCGRARAKLREGQQLELYTMEAVLLNSKVRHQK